MRAGVGGGVRPRLGAAGWGGAGSVGMRAAGASSLGRRGPVCWGPVCSGSGVRGALGGSWRPAAPFPTSHLPAHRDLASTLKPHHPPHPTPQVPAQGVITSRPRPHERPAAAPGAPSAKGPARGMPGGACRQATHRAAAPLAPRPPLFDPSQPTDPRPGPGARHTDGRAPHPAHRVAARSRPRAHTRPCCRPLRSPHTSAPEGRPEERAAARMAAAARVARTLSPLAATPSAGGFPQSRTSRRPCGRQSGLATVGRRAPRAARKGADERGGRCPCNTAQA